jgi:hypothetical protein
VETDSGTTGFTFTVTLAGDVDGGFTVPFSSADGTATTAGGDYVAATGTLTFAGTDAETQTLTVTVNGDTLVEADETFTVTLGTPSNASVTASDGTGQGTIQNDDDATVAIDDVAQVETDSGTTGFVFTVTLAGDVDGGFTVPFSSADGTATTADGDYVAAAGTLTFAGTDAETQILTVTVNGDTVVEPDETFTVTLGPASNPSVTASDGTGQGTIQNDDSATVAIDDVSQVETDSGTTGFVFTVTLAGDVDGGFTVPFSTADGTATSADGDYTATSGTLTFAGTSGETQTLTAAVNGDTVVEADETFTVSLGAPSNESVSVADGTGLGTIQNDDAATVAISDVSQTEGDAGTTDFLFTLTLSSDVAGGFTLDYATADGSATLADGDYVATAGTLTFTGTAGETQAVAVEVVGDLVVEGDETFTVELATPSNPDVTVTDGLGLGTLVNDDEGPIFELTKEILEYDSGSGRVDYLLRITNLGSAAQVDDPASDELEDVLPDGLELLSADSDSPTFAVVADLPSNTVLGNGSIGAGETVVILLSAGVTAAPGDEVSNQALARYDADNDGINDTTIVSDDPSTPEPDDATILLVVADALEIPTLGEWGRLLLVLLLGAAAVQRLRRRPWKVA